MDARGFTPAHDGNITVRVGVDKFLCTPSLINKARMQPSDIAIIDGDGSQLSGDRPRSSEALLHLEIYRRRPDVVAVVHCHPPHAVAVAMTLQRLPRWVLPEVEVLLGEVPIVPYATPGTAELGQSIRPFVDLSVAMILANHGTVTAGDSLEQAFWRTEVLDAYCHQLILARSLGPVRTLNDDQRDALIRIKEHWQQRGSSDQSSGFQPE